LRHLFFGLFPSLRLRPQHGQTEYENRQVCQ
jgi:hypothetical protein